MIKSFKKYANHNNHQYFKSYISYSSSKLRKTKKYITWTKQVLKRDKCTCKRCGSKTDITVHHICSLQNLLIKNKVNSFKEAKNCEELWDINNGITLCKKCHLKEHDIYYKK
jgi:5-methylcytosine-specific restriction endonuclease McrA